MLSIMIVQNSTRKPTYFMASNAKWMTQSMLLLVIYGCCVLTFAGEWDEHFADPPADARILKIIHNWPDQPDGQDQYIKTFQQQGFGGVVCNVSFDQYLESDDKWAAFTRAVNTAKKAGFAMWLYDERGYPSGNAGGITLRDHPEWEADGLLVADTQSQAGPVTLDLPPGKLILAGAFEIHRANIDITKQIDLTSQVRDGRLNWQAPAGHWYVMAITENRLFEGTHAAGNLYAKIPYINLLMPEPTARFVDVTYDSYTKHLGNNLGKYFMASFTDEPSLMSLFLKPMPYRPLPWAPNLPAEFQKRRGYPLDTNMIPALVVDAGSAGEKIRYDFWLTVGELVSENYFGQIQNRCRQYGIPSGGHLLAEEGIAGHVPLYGDFFRCIRRLDAPSIDCLTSIPSEVPWFIARLISSAAELEDRPLVMSETSDHSQQYRPAGDQRPKRIVTEAEIRGTCNRLIVAGVNCITSYYSFADLSDEQLVRLNQWVGRCCTAVRGGHQVADIAVLYPAESLWTRFVPSRQWTKQAGAASRIDTVYRTVADSLFDSQRDFTFIDSQELIKATVEPAFLVDGQLRWRVIILPCVDTLPLAAWENLETFVRQGGVVIALGELPKNSESQFPSPRVRALAKAIFGTSQVDSSSENKPYSHMNDKKGIGVFLPFGLESLVPNVLDSLLDPDVKVTPAGSPLRVTHRRIDDREVYLIINDSAEPWEGQVDFAAEGMGERWNPANGLMEATVPARSAQVTLESYGASLFRFTTPKLPNRRTMTSEALPTLILRDIPATEPTVLKGEFVQAEMTQEAETKTKARTWHTTGILTKSDVDTFLFTQFHYPQVLDLGGADCLAVETRVPDEQSAPTKILVILHEAGGGDFIAETGRSLAVSGTEKSFIAMNRFHLAGWSKDNDNVLDLKKVSDIRIGWGGYYGAEHEKVQFSLSPPQAGEVKK